MIFCPESRTVSLVVVVDLHVVRIALDVALCLQRGILIYLDPQNGRMKASSRYRTCFLDP